MREKFYIFLFSIVLLNSFIQVTSNDKIVLPLYYINNSDGITNYIEYLFQPQLYTKIKLGNPEQIIYLLITTDSDYFSIEADDINPKFYDSNISSTFTNTNNKLSFYNERYKLGFICLEQFYFINDLNTMQEELYQNLSFDYIYELSEEYINKKYYIDNQNNEISGIIGLEFPKSFSCDNFLIRLKNIEAIQKNIWSIIFINSNPYLIVGEDPYINNNSEMRKTNCYNSGYYQHWFFLFSDIKVGDTKLNEERIAQYSPQFGGIIGTKEYKNYIRINFFDDLIKNGKCFEKNITINDKIYSYYECDININLNNFKPIEFIHQELSYKFILEKNDLFIDFNGRKYFLCIFLEESENPYYTTKNWIFGLSFIKKYNFVFDQDAKMILFYDKENSNKNIETNIESPEDSPFHIGIIIFLAVFTGLILIYLLIRFIFKPKQIKANELEDSFRYKNQASLSNKDIMNSIYNSKYNQLGV